MVTDIRPAPNDASDRLERFREELETKLEMLKQEPLPGPVKGYQLPRPADLLRRWAAFRIGLLPHLVHEAFRTDRYLLNPAREHQECLQELTVAHYDLQMARDILVGVMSWTVYKALSETLDRLGRQIRHHERALEPAPMHGLAICKPCITYDVANQLAVLSRSVAEDDRTLRSWMDLGSALGGFQVATLELVDALFHRSTETAISQRQGEYSGAFKKILECTDSLGPRESAAHPFLRAINQPGAHDSFLRYVRSTWSTGYPLVKLAFAHRGDGFYWWGQVVRLLAFELGPSLSKDVCQPPRTAQTGKPRWDPVTGKLWYAGSVIRTVRSDDVAKNIRLILSSFQKKGWTKRIESPFEYDGVKNDTIKSLNSSLEAIRFRPDGTGKGIHWERL